MELWRPKMDGCLRDPATDVARRVRGTAGGDRLSVDYPVSTHTASLSTLNALFNATVSEDATFGSIDLNDFYLGTPLPEPSYIRIYMSTFSDAVISRLGLRPFFKTDKSGKELVLFRIDKTMYGLKEAGILSNEKVVIVEVGLVGFDLFFK